MRHGALRPLFLLLLFVFLTAVSVSADTTRLNPELYGEGRCPQDGSAPSGPCSEVWSQAVSPTNFCNFLLQAQGDAAAADCSSLVSDVAASQPGVSPEPQPTPFVPRDDVAMCTNLEGIFNCTDAAWLYCQQFPDPASCRILGWNPCHFWQDGDAHEVVIRPGTQPNEWCIVDPTEGTEVHCWIAPNGPTSIPDEAWEKICQMRRAMGMNCPPGHRGPPPNLCHEILPGDRYDACGARKRRWDECGIPSVLQDYCDYINEREVSCPSLPLCSSLEGKLCARGRHPNEFWGPSLPSTACRDVNPEGKPNITYLRCDCSGSIAPIRCYWKRPDADLLPRCDRMLLRSCNPPGSKSKCRRPFTNPSQTVELVCNEDGVWVPQTRPRPNRTPTPSSTVAPTPTTGGGGEVKPR